MKKFVALIAVLALCLSCVAGLAESDLASAKAYLYQLYKNASRTDLKVTTIDYDVLNKVLIGGVEYTVEWASDTASVKVIEKEDATTIDVPAIGAAEVIYTLTATVKDAEGNAQSVSFKRMIPAGATTGVLYADAPVVGTAYKFALNQANLGSTLYLTGEMSGNYLATTTNILEAADVYVEETEGGYYVYFNAGDAKKYVNITTYAKADGSLKNTQKIEDAPSVPYTWDADRHTFIADLGEVGQFYMGTYSTYNTISTSNVSYISDISKIGVSQFPAGLYDVQLPNE